MNGHRFATIRQSPFLNQIFRAAYFNATLLRKTPIPSISISHQIPRLERAGVPGRARENHVAGEQGHMLTDITHDGGRIEEQLAEFSRLHHRAVHSSGHPALGPVKTQGNRRA